MSAPDINWGEMRADDEDYSAGNRRSHYLHPGQLHVTLDPSAVTTILASCVGVFLWDAKQRIGGVNHFLLPEAAMNAAQPHRYGNLSVEILVDRMLMFGCSRGDLQAKVFGGASMRASGGDGELGARNVAVAQLSLRAAGIRVVAGDTGGTRARRLVFHTDDGNVWLWRI